MLIFKVILLFFISKYWLITYYIVKIKKCKNIFSEDFTRLNLFPIY